MKSIWSLPSYTRVTVDLGVGVFTPGIVKVTKYIPVKISKIRVGNSRKMTLKIWNKVEPMHMYV